MGIEPTAICLASKSSTTELPPQYIGGVCGHLTHLFFSVQARRPLQADPYPINLLVTTLRVSLQHSARDTLTCLVSSRNRFDDLLHSSSTCAFTPCDARHYKGY